MNFKAFFGSSRLRIGLLGAVSAVLLFFTVRHIMARDEPDYTAYWVAQEVRLEGVTSPSVARSFLMFNQELLRNIAREEGISIQFLPSLNFPWKTSIMHGEVDGVLAAIDPRVEREEHQWIYSESYLPLGAVLIIPKSVTHEDWEKQGRRVVGIYQPLVSSELPLLHDPLIELRIFRDPLAALSDLKKGVLDGVVYPLIPARTYVDTFYPLDLQIVFPPLTDEGCRLVAFKYERGEKLIGHFNAGLDALKKNGVYNRLLKKWQLQRPEEDQ